MHTLTFGDDGSVGASAAWAWITAQKWPGWQVDVVTAVHPDDSLAESDRTLHEWVPPVPRTMPETCECSGVKYLSAAGDARSVLCEDPNSELVVVGARGKGFLKWLHIGSTAHGLLHNPEKAILIGRTVDPVRRVLVCIDGSAHADRAAEFAAGLPWIAGTHVVVVSVVDGTADLSGKVEEVRARFEAAGATAEAVIIEPNPLILTVNVRDSLLEAVSTLTPDLVVAGMRGMSTMERISIGSIADTIAQRASCSVLLVR
jgi:nucleotide-binding universal stress UspA family protein